MAHAREKRRRPAAAARSASTAPAVPDIAGILVGSLEQRWHGFQMQLRRTRRGCTDASVHDLRVSLRRLMATVDMIRTLIPADGLQRTRESLRKHLKEFNQLRDTHIQILALRSLAREFPPLRPLGVELRRRKAKLLRAARGTIASIDPPKLERALADASVRLGALLRIPGMQDVARATAVGAMGSAFVRAFDLRQQVNPADPSSIHRLRVAFKKCRYMMEVLRPFLPGVDTRFLKGLNAYQTRMGEIQDLQVVTACVNGYTLNSRYAPTLSLVPVQARLAEMRKQRIDAFLAGADQLYDLWTASLVEPNAAPSPSRPSRGARVAASGTRRAGGGAGRPGASQVVKHSRARVAGKQEPAGKPRTKNARPAARRSRS